MANLVRSSWADKAAAVWYYREIDCTSQHGAQNRSILLMEYLPFDCQVDQPHRLRRVNYRTDVGVVPAVGYSECCVSPTASLQMPHCLEFLQQSLTSIKRLHSHIVQHQRLDCDWSFDPSRAARRRVAGKLVKGAGP